MEANICEMARFKLGDRVTARVIVVVRGESHVIYYNSTVFGVDIYYEPGANYDTITKVRYKLGNTLQDKHLAWVEGDSVVGRCLMELKNG